MPKASVIVPVYNVEGYLEKCVQSVLAQTEKDFELLLAAPPITAAGFAILWPKQTAASG